MLLKYILEVWMAMENITIGELPRIVVIISNSVQRPDQKSGNLRTYIS